MTTRSTDNLRSTVSEQEAAWGFDTGVGVRLDARDERWESSINPRANLRRFLIGENADAEEFSVYSDHSLRLSQFGELRLGANFVRDSTLTSELDASGGLATVPVNRDTVTIRPGLSLQLTERDSLNIDFLYSDVSFEERPGGGFVDYRYLQGTLGASHVITDRLYAYANAYASEFKTPSTGGRALTIGGQAGASYSISETLSADFSLGYSSSDIDFLSNEVSGSVFVGIDAVTGAPVFLPVFSSTQRNTVQGGPIASVSIRKRFSDSIASLDYARSVSPSTRGSQTLSDDIKLRLTQNYTSRLSGFFVAGYNIRTIESSELTQNAGFLDRNQLILSATARYEVSEEVAVSASYRFFKNDLPGSRPSAYNNSLFVNLIYTGTPHFF